jgi:hypothetical protein
LVRARVLGEPTSGLRVLSRYEEALAVGRKACDAADRVLSRALLDTVRPPRIRLFADPARCHEATGDLTAARTTADKAVSARPRPASSRPPASKAPALGAPSSPSPSR